MSDIRALTFDVFGTVVDWRSGVAREAEALLAPKGLSLDWGALPIGSARRAICPPWPRWALASGCSSVLDALHRENLVGLLAERGVALAEAEIDSLNLAWHRWTHGLTWSPAWRG